MNNDLEKFSEERLKEIADFAMAGAIEVVELARIALAAKQAKPVGVFVTVNEYTDTPYVSWLSSAYKLSAGDKLYTTPPANSPEIPDGWIKCSERMPEGKSDTSIEYLVYEKMNGRVQHDYWNVPDGEKACQAFWNHYGKSVTHWMPLPAAPKPESE